MEIKSKIYPWKNRLFELICWHVHNDYIYSYDISGTDEIREFRTRATRYLKYYESGGIPHQVATNSKYTIFPSLIEEFGIQGLKKHNEFLYGWEGGSEVNFQSKLGRKPFPLKFAICLIGIFENIKNFGDQSEEDALFEYLRPNGELEKWCEHETSNTGLDHFIWGGINEQATSKSWKIIYMQKIWGRLLKCEGNISKAQTERIKELGHQVAYTDLYNYFLQVARFCPHLLTPKLLLNIIDDDFKYEITLLSSKPTKFEKHLKSLSADEFSELVETLEF